ncbi:MAG: DUF4287 domain-containing protein [Panacibacter sp.]
MDAAIQTMIREKNTRKSLDEWVKIVQKKSLAKHGGIIKFLKEEYNFTHGFPNLVAHKSKGSDAGSVEDKDSLTARQYSGKEHLIPVYEKLLASIKTFGNDVELAPKNDCVSLRRKKQFGCLQPATKARFEVGLSLKGEPGKGILEEVKATNTMFS